MEVEQEGKPAPAAMAIQLSRDGLGEADHHHLIVITVQHPVVGGNVIWVECLAGVAGQRENHGLGGSGRGHRSCYEVPAWPLGCLTAAAPWRGRLGVTMMLS